jgi:hypothetical protein
MRREKDPNEIMPDTKCLARTNRKNNLQEIMPDTKISAPEWSPVNSMGEYDYTDLRLI